ncbi:hypothetical protein [Nocardia brasiliensis]|uniref:hypothetical protein n=1 Tax=Nocardia brasiliensis TaxID=37326 RepID=UPI0011DD7DDC|nr:hypothetical protein [Nocardia brasiliensis]
MIMRELQIWDHSQLSDIPRWGSSQPGHADPHRRPCRKSSSTYRVVSGSKFSAAANSDKTDLKTKQDKYQQAVTRHQLGSEHVLSCCHRFTPRWRTLGQPVTARPIAQDPAPRASEKAQFNTFRERKSGPAGMASGPSPMHLHNNAFGNQRISRTHFKIT